MTECNEMDKLVFEFPKAKGIVVSGDIHGDFTQLVFKCCDQYSMTDTLIIVAGDCGFGFDRPGYYENIYKKCNKKLSKVNNWLLFIRGNHDNPAYFNLQPIKYRRWMTLPDYSVVKACGHTILCVGGATSIDRLLRITAKNYHLPNPNEPLAPNVTNSRISTGRGLTPLMSRAPSTRLLLTPHRRSANCPRIRD